MSDGQRRVTLQFEVQPTGTPPDMRQFSAPVIEYYRIITSQAADAVRANGLVGESFRRIASEITATNQQMTQFGTTAVNISTYFQNVTQNSTQAAESVRLLTEQYNLMSQAAAAAAANAPAAGNLNWSQTGGPGQGGWAGGSGGGGGAAAGINEVGDALVDVNGQVAATIQNLEHLINTARSFAEIEPGVRLLGESLMNATNVPIDQREAGIQALIENARAQFEQIQTLSNRASQQMSRNWAGAANSMSSAITASGRLVSAIGFLTGQSDDVEKLAKQFASVQIAMQAMSAQSSMFNSMSEGLQRLQVASTAAQTSLTIMGASASFTTRMLAGIGPAALAAQAALGPISVVMSLISVAVVAAQAAIALWGETTEDSAKRSEEAMKRYADQLKEVTRELNAQTQGIDLQTQATMQLYEARKFARGGSFTAEEAIAAGQRMTEDANAKISIDMRAALAQAKASVPESVQKERAEVLARIQRQEQIVAERERQVRLLEGIGGSPLEEVKRKAKILSSSPNISSEQASEFDPWTDLEMERERLRQADRKSGFGALEAAVADPTNLEAISKGLDNFSKRLPEAANILEKAMQGAMAEQGKAIRFTAGELQVLLREEQQRLRGDKGDMTIGPDGKPIVSFQDEIDKELRKFEVERKIAQDLNADPARLFEIQQKIQMAPTPMAGLGVLAPFMPNDQEQALRADPNLTTDKLMEALKDAREFETEAEALDQFIDAQNAKAEKYVSSLGKLLGMISSQQDAMDALAKDMELVKRAAR